VRRVFTLSGVLVFVSALAFAETFAGRLVDAACVAQKMGGACTPTTSTASFAILASGKLLKLDAAGNKKAAEAMKERDSSADRSKDPNALNSGVTAVVEGTANGDEIQVDTIQLN
jgi:hypothetical protein